MRAHLFVMSVLMALCTRAQAPAAVAPWDERMLTIHGHVLDHSGHFAWGADISANVEQSRNDPNSSSGKSFRYFPAVGTLTIGRDGSFELRGFPGRWWIRVVRKEVGGSTLEWPQGTHEPGVWVDVAEDINGLDIRLEYPTLHFEGASSSLDMTTPTQGLVIHLD